MLASVSPFARDSGRAQWMSRLAHSLYTQARFNTKYSPAIQSEMTAHRASGRARAGG